jgi:hypothetical protein
MARWKYENESVIASRALRRKFGRMEPERLTPYWHGTTPIPSGSAIIAEPNVIVNPFRAKRVR